MWLEKLSTSQRSYERMFARSGAVLGPVLAALLGAMALAGCIRPAPSATTAHGAQHDAAAGLSAGQEFDDCDGANWCPRMVVVTAGSFTIGAPPNEPGRYQEEGPQRRVNIRSLAIGKFDVTRAQWAAFASATNRITNLGCAWTGQPMSVEGDPAASWKNPSFAQDDSHPVVCVSWSDARDYLHWLSERTGRTYRLLSEAEWEYAARAGTTTAFPWGASASHDYANYGADKCCGGLATGRDRWVATSPVGSFPANAFGLYDMNGNVSQWVQDCFANSYEALSTDGSAYQVNVRLKLTGELASMSGTNSCSYRVARGGGWGDFPALVRSAARNFAPPPGGVLATYRSSGFGFRAARVLN